MGWADCGYNVDLGVPMGYAHQGVCMGTEDCSTEIHHGLANVCGGMHEGGEWGCGRYCCEWHLVTFEVKPNPDPPYSPWARLCPACESRLRGEGRIRVDLLGEEYLSAEEAL